jgi:hypothetical protein
MNTTFLSRLQAIRQDADRRQAQRRRVDAVLERSEGWIRTCGFRDSLEQLVSARVDELSDEAPGFILSRSCFDGRYMLAVRQVHRDGVDGRSSFSRLTIFMALDTASGQATLECRRTVRNRDLEADRVTVPMTPESLQGLEARIESWFLEFAEAYFGSRLAA